MWLTYSFVIQDKALATNLNTVSGQFWRTSSFWGRCRNLNFCQSIMNLSQVLYTFWWLAKGVKKLKKFSIIDCLESMWFNFFFHWCDQPYDTVFYCSLFNCFSLTKFIYSLSFFVVISPCKDRSFTTFEKR